MKYYELNKTIAEKVNKYLYSLMYKENEIVETIYLFQIVTIATIDLIIIDETQLHPIFTKSITNKTLTDILAQFGSKFTAAQKTKFTNYLLNNTKIDLVQIFNLLPERTQQWFDDNAPKLPS